MAKGVFDDKLSMETSDDDFFWDLLQALGENNHPQAVYALLKFNLGKLDDKFAAKLQFWAIGILKLAKPEQRYDLAKCINQLSNLIRDFPLGSRNVNIESSLTGYEVCLRVFIRSLFPVDWAMIQHNLGNVYAERIKGEKAENLEKAIMCFQAALEVTTHSTFPVEWAETMRNLGCVYLDRIKGEKAENLEKAIDCCQTALQVFNYSDFAKDWATTQLAIGNASLYRIKGDRVENLEKAIACFKASLKVHTLSEFPGEWATTQNNIGIAYRNCIKGNKIANLEDAINRFKYALKVYTYCNFPVYWARTQNNLGNAYLCRIKGERSDNLENALACFKAAQKVYNLYEFPVRWAMTKLNEGNTYVFRIKGAINENLENAIACFKAALEVYKRSSFPVRWAAIQNNLGTAYLAQEQKAEAIQAFKFALEIFTPESFPRDCFRSGKLLGNTAFTACLWETAIPGYEVAIKAIETSRSWVTSDFRRQEILAESLDVYDNMVQACINAGQLEKALETIERSRAKRLVDLMASNDLYQSDEIAPDVKELLQKFDDLQQRIDQERIQKKSSNNRELMGIDSHRQNRAAFQAENDAIASLEAEKLHIWEQLRRLDPVLAGEIKVDAPNFDQIQQLIDEPTTAILSLYTTTNDLHLFILRQNQLTLHICPGQGINTLQHFISQNWLQPYVEDKSNWKSHINTFLNELSQRLQLTELTTNHLNGIDELIIIPHLLLHQIPFAALPIPNSSPDSKNGASRDYFGDQFLIRYTPSCQILTFCQQRRDRDVETFPATQYGTVEDATDDLPFASFEGEQIANLHNIPDNLRLKGKTQATVKNYRQLVNQVQVIHSSHHAEFRLDNPLESVLKLADGHITLGQLMTPGWRLPDLFDVFLSCCETGLGLPEITDDSLTLSTGFLCAGARSVVSTLWSVADLATALFSIFYYQQRQQGKNRPEALRYAQIQLRELQKDELLNREDIKEFCQQAEVKRKEARQKYYKITKQIQAIKKSPDEYPFSQPRFWAAFTCQGLR